MDLILIKGSWEQLTIKLKKEYPQLTKSDLQYVPGEEENMLRMIEYKLRKTKEEMSEIISGYTMFTP